MNRQLIALTATLLLAACGGGGNNGGGGGSGGGSAGGSAGGSGGGSGPASAIDGTWSASCQTLNGNGPPGGASENWTLVFGGGDFTYTSHVFSDGACATPVLTIVESGGFTLGAAEQTPAGSDDISFAVASNTATPLTQTETSLLNTANNGASACAGVTFTLNQPANISGANCGGGGGSSVQTADGSTLINVVYDNTSATPNTLQLGSENDQNDNLGVASTGTRPTQLGSLLFTKQ